MERQVGPEPRGDVDAAEVSANLLAARELGAEASRILRRDGALNLPDEAPGLRFADEAHWYTEHTALVISTLKWSLFGAVAGLCVGFATRGFLWALASSDAAVRTLLGPHFQPSWLLPLALPPTDFDPG
jgi:hypothetical protein